MVHVRDAAATKERILEAAFAEFAARGFAGTRVDEIAERAQCNKALLYQYYGDKEALFRHVLECKMQALGTLDGDPEALAETAGKLFDFYAANRWLPRLLMWEALDFGSDPVPNEAARKKRFDQHVERIKEAQDAGSVEPTLDPRQVLVTLIGLIQIWFTAPQAARMICGGDPYSPKALKTRRAHVVEAARRILEAR